MREGNLLLLPQLLPPPASWSTRPLYELITSLLRQGCQNAAWEQHPGSKTSAEESTKASVPRLAGALRKGTRGAHWSPAKQDTPRQSTGRPVLSPHAGSTHVMQTHHPKGLPGSRGKVPPRHTKGPRASAPLTQAAPQ